LETYRLRLLDRIAIAIVVPLLYLLGWTLRTREAGRLDWSLRAPREHALWSLWHETLLPGTWFFRRLDVHVMISASRDGELIARITQHLGYTPVRGSTSKGALGATRKLVASLREGKRTAITPDGPRGPRRRAQPGMIGVARLTGRPIVALGIAVDRAWRLGSWDRFVIPKPFARVCYAYGEPICVPREGGSDAEHLARIQGEMERVTALAESAVARDQRAR